MPKYCRASSLLEKYNGFTKQKMGKHRIINLINFLDFIKRKSEYYCKAHELKNSNIIYYKDNNGNKINKNDYILINENAKESSLLKKFK